MEEVSTETNSITVEEALALHDYCDNGVSTGEMETSTATKITRPLPETPTKPPILVKRIKLREATAKETEVTNATILDAVNNLSAMLQEMNLQLKQNTAMITEVTKSVEFNAKEIEVCKSHNATVQKQVTKLEKQNAGLQEKVSELERYKRRWNLKLRGLKEKDNENTREVVSQILTKIAPQWSDKINLIVDSVHRLGKKEKDRNRHVVIQFTMRHFRDELWRQTKGSALCKDLNINFAEHILPADKEARAAVWPQIKKAREAGQRAYFRGPVGYINGTPIKAT